MEREAASELLGVPRDAPSRDVESAYQRRSRALRLLIDNSGTSRLRGTLEAALRDLDAARSALLPPAEPAPEPAAAGAGLAGGAAGVAETRPAGSERSQVEGVARAARTAPAGPAATPAATGDAPRAPASAAPREPAPRAPGSAASSPAAGTPARAALPQPTTSSPEAESAGARTDAPARAGAGAGPASGTRLGPCSGQLLRERYELRRLLGSGTSEDLYAAFDRERGCEVALRVLPAGSLPTGEAGERFAAELRQWSSLGHSHVARALDWGEAGELEFLSAELLDGETLRERLERRRGGGLGFELGEVRGVANALCRALEAVHRAGAHGALRPEHVFLCSDGSLRLLEGGPLRALRPGPGARAGGAPASAYYVPPEQLRGAASPDTRADQYCAAVLLYELLTGTVPLGRASSARELRPEVPAGLSQALDRALAVSPAERFPTVAAFREALAGPSRLGRPLRVAGAAALAAALAAVVAFATPLGPWARAQLRGAPGERLPTVAAGGRAAQAPAPSRYIAAHDASVAALRFSAGRGASVQHVFERRRTRGVNWQLQLLHSARPGGEPLQLAVRWYRRGELSHEEAYSGKLAPAAPGSLETLHSGGWAPRRGLPAGEWRVDFYADANLVASSSFQVCDSLDGNAECVLLARADRQLAAFKLSSPPGDNALETYQRLLELQPVQSVARAGIATLRDIYAGQGRSAEARGELQEAQAAYEKAARVAPEDRSLAALLERASALVRQADEERRGAPAGQRPRAEPPARAAARPPAAPAGPARPRGGAPVAAQPKPSAAPAAARAADPCRESCVAQRTQCEDEAGRVFLSEYDEDESCPESKNCRERLNTRKELPGGIDACVALDRVCNARTRQRYEDKKSSCQSDAEACRQRCE